MEPSPSLEIERKYDVDADTPLPDWSGMPGVARVGEPEPRELDARYLDTADGHLAGSLTALRRRSGGPDAGWHIKRSTPEGKLETHFPLDETTDAGADPIVPDAVLAALVRLAAVDGGRDDDEVDDRPGAADDAELHELPGGVHDAARRLPLNQTGCAP